MIIKYRDGRVVDAVLVSSNEETMRVAVKGGDDLLILKCVNRTWISEDCEPVDVQYAWQGFSKAPVVESDCICSKELAARLIRLLLDGGDENECPMEVPLGQPHRVYPLQVV